MICYSESDSTLWVFGNKGSLLNKNPLHDKYSNMDTIKKAMKLGFRTFSTLVKSISLRWSKDYTYLITKSASSIRLWYYDCDSLEEVLVFDIKKILGCLNLIVKTEVIELPDTTNMSKHFFAHTYLEEEIWNPSKKSKYNNLKSLCEIFSRKENKKLPITCLEIDERSATFMYKEKEYGKEEYRCRFEIIDFEQKKNNNSVTISSSILDKLILEL